MLGVTRRLVSLFIHFKKKKKNVNNSNIERMEQNTKPNEFFFYTGNIS